MTRRVVVAVALAVACSVTSGCSSFDSVAVRNLTEAEVAVLQQTRSRLGANQASVNASLDDLADNVEFALMQQQRLDSNIAKSMLLESMKSPWTNSGLDTTQREVALYHLFALEQAEQAALRARIAARRSSIDTLRSAYAELTGSMSSLVAAQEQLLVHLDQPAATQIDLFLQQVVAESRAFRAALDTDDPGLRRLQGEVERREADIEAARQRIVEMLERLGEE